MRLALLAIREEPDLDIPAYAFDGTELKTVEQVAAAMGIPVIEATLRMDPELKAVVRSLAFWGPRGYKLGETIRSGAHADRRRLRHGEHVQVDPEKQVRNATQKAHAVVVDGVKYIRKLGQFSHGKPLKGAKDNADSEYFGALIGHALGAPVPDVIRSPRKKDEPHTVYVEYVAQDLPPDDQAEREALIDTPAGVRIGLLDAITYQGDRWDGGNWGVVEDEEGNHQPFAFDFAQIYFPGDPYWSSLSEWESGSEFAVAHFIEDVNGEWALKDNPLTPDQVKHYRETLRGLEEEFRKASRLAWYYELLSRFEKVAAHATGVDVEAKDVFSASATHAMGVGVGTRVSGPTVEDRARRLMQTPAQVLRKKKRRKNKRPTEEEA